MTTIFVYEDVTATWATGDAQLPVAPSLLAEGRAMREAVVADFESIPGLRVLSPWGQNSASAQISAIEADLCRNVRLADFTLLIAPETGGRLEHLARDVIRLGGKLLGPSPEAIRLASDKLELARQWDTNGVPTPRTWPMGEQPSGVRMIVKPRDGAGSQGVLLTPGHLEHGAQELIAQEYVDGFSASVAFLVGEPAITPLLPCQQLLSDDGRFQYFGGRLPIEPALAERAIAIATLAIGSLSGLCGYVGVDVVLGEDGRDWAIEINPRLTTSYVGLRALARLNLIEIMLKLVRGESVPKLEWSEDTIEFTADGRVTRFASASLLTG